MSRILVYCGFRHAPELVLPAVGVNAAPVQVASFDNLDLLWSEVEWPFARSECSEALLSFMRLCGRCLSRPLLFRSGCSQCSMTSRR